MKFPLRVPRSGALPFTSLLLIIAASALSPVCANDLQPLTDAERYVLQKLQEGQGADLEDRFPSELRVLRGSFVAALLTNRDYRSGASLYTIWIRKGVIIGELDLRGKDIPYDTFLDNCTFKDNVYFTRSHFVQVLDLSGSEFLQDAYFSGANIGYDFVAEDCSFQSDLANFERLRTDRSFRIGGSTFKSIRTSFEGMKVGGRFTADKAIFRSKDVSFAEMRVDGDFSVQGCTFDFDKADFEKKVYKSPETRDSSVSFIGAHVADLFLNNSTFANFSSVDFTRLQADLISVDGVSSKTPARVNRERMTFKLLSPMNTGQLGFLLSPYNAEFYANLESSFRTHGYPDEADKIFIAKKRAERRENCKSFLHECQRGRGH